MRRAHEDAIDGAGFDAERTEHALAVVDREAGDFESFAPFDPLLADVDAVDWTKLGALVARNASGQVEAMEAAIARRDWHRQLGILKQLGKRLPLRSVSLDPNL